MSSLFGRLSDIHYMYPLKTKEEEETSTKGLIEDTVVTSSSEDGMVHCIFDFVHGHLSSCKVRLFAGQKQCLHSSGATTMATATRTAKKKKKTIGLY